MRRTGESDEESWTPEHLARWPRWIDPRTFEYWEKLAAEKYLLNEVHDSYEVRLSWELVHTMRALGYNDSWVLTAQPHEVAAMVLAHYELHLEAGGAPWKAVIEDKLQWEITLHR